MKEKVITIADASRNFVDCAHRAAREGATFLVTEGGAPIAKIGPVESTVCDGAKLAAELRPVLLSAEEEKAFAEDLRRGHTALIAPEDAWG